MPQFKNTIIKCCPDDIELQCYCIKYTPKYLNVAGIRKPNCVLSYIFVVPALSCKQTGHKAIVLFLKSKAILWIFHWGNFCSII